MKALFIGIQSAGTTSQRRADTLREIVSPCSWTMIDTGATFQRYPRWAQSMRFRLRSGPAVWAMNRMLLAELTNVSEQAAERGVSSSPGSGFLNVSEMSDDRQTRSTTHAELYDIAWIDKGVCLWPQTVRKIRQLARKMVYYTPDTSFFANRSRFFEATASLYDLIVTTKLLELSSYEALVPRDRIALVTQSFDAKHHMSHCTFQKKRKEAVLIGLCEPDREQCVECLLSNGIAVRVGGIGWERLVRRHAGNDLLRYEGPRVFGEHYSNVISRASVGLGLLTKQFPELHTTRTFEIPACGTALATVRTSDTSQFFGEDEVIFFADYGELALRIKELMNDEHQLRAVTEAGTRRVQSGDFSNERVLRKVLSLVGISCASELPRIPAHHRDLSARGGVQDIAIAEPRMVAQPLVEVDLLDNVSSAASASSKISRVHTESPASVDSRSGFAKTVEPSVRAKENYCIGFLGADWWGSDARALECEFRRQGHMLVDRHYEDYFPTKWRSLSLRGWRRVMRGAMARGYNAAVEELLEIMALDFLLVFKGMLLKPGTLRRFREAGTPCYCVYPDVSYQDHGDNIWQCLPLYDCVFTTKAFHFEDSTIVNRVQDLQLIPHGFDPEVHRPLTLSGEVRDYYACDVSFVGVWSPKKERILASLIDEAPELSVKIWGPFWDRAGASVRDRWQGRGAYGDELAAICSCSRINLGLLSEAGLGTSSGDRTTARTWQIPACGGFMLHEDTAELRQFFEVGSEIAAFQDKQSLVQSVRKYLVDPVCRERVKTAGYERCVRGQYSYRPAYEQILAYHRGNSVFE
ncbi:MAG TPA: glycosyltransferase [Planctomycetaceae bacterium]|nr:glycosyltransferase [Planctomycetaceae bacterium]